MEQNQNPCTRKYLVDYLNAYLEIDRYRDYCPNGLQVEGKAQISRIGVAVTACEETIESAIASEVDALIVHHGLFWDRGSHVAVGSMRRKLKALLDAEINLLAYHLPLDGHCEVGNNWVAARELRAEECEACFPLNGMPIGVKGRISPVSYENFAETLNRYYSHKVHVAPGGDHLIEKVAFLSGGGHKMLFEAVKEGCDALVTGSFDEPLWYQAREEGIHFFALGHSATEEIGPRALGRHLEELFDVECLFINTYNPF